MATSVTQVETIRNQLGDKVDIVVEPERRNTFPVIALCAANLFYEKYCDGEETVVVLPVDPYVEYNHRGDGAGERVFYCQRGLHKHACDQ